MKRVYAAIGALLLAATVTVGTTGWSPLCLLYEPWSIQWVALGCWYGEPDPPPCSNCG
jgi:hypothetical protein